MKHTLDELRQWQALPLSIKIRMTKERIRQWINEYGEDGVYVSFSGGKDSTVLLDLVRQDYPNVVAVFVDTGLEYPEIRNFVKTFDNVVWLKPKLTFKEVIKKYGYPFISKEVSQSIDEVKSYIEKKHDGSPKYSYRWKKLNGEAIDKKTGKPSSYNIPQWKFLLDSPYKISDKCCKVMKKSPVHSYEKQTNKQPITAQMASESRLRTQKWLENGCNGFDMKKPISNPMSFWTEQDVLLYIKQYNIPICSVYGEIVEDTDGTNEVAGQMTISDLAGWENMELFDAERLPLKTTGCSRTGCMFCGFGCHLNNDQRFVKMKETHPKQYDYIMRPESEGGLNYKEIIDWINEHGNLNIKY
jgi:3'-phosphoadenosine 5'-phosphosulfate sulfotransferase (PAPS reductase)/FAD synthetase